MWKFQYFSATQILREINFIILKPQKLPFWPYELHWILTFEIFLTFPSVKIQKKFKFKALKIVKMTVFDPLKLAKLISRKIKVAGKLLNFHTVFRGCLLLQHVRYEPTPKLWVWRKIDGRTDLRTLKCTQLGKCDRWGKWFAFPELIRKSSST